jgi:phage baseplate assembly protein gpV
MELGGKGGSMNGGARRPPRFDEIPTGTKVVIQGLQSAPQHNGKEGAVQGYNAASQRYTIELPDGEVALKTARLTIMVDNCKVTGITSKPELNGSRGRVVNYDPEKGRYTVILSSGAGISLSPSNLILPEGTKAVVQGLQSEAAAVYNEKRGLIESYDAQAERYQVKVSDDKSLKIKLENLRA